MGRNKAKKSRKANYKSSMGREVWHRLKKNRLAMVGLFILAMVVLIAIFAPVIAPHGYDDQNAADALSFPCWKYPFGTDNFGRDILSRMIYGSRITLLVGASAVTVSAAIGCTLGIIAGFYKKTENWIMRTMDIIGGIPYLLLAIAIGAALGSGLTNMVLAVALSAIPGYARIARASVLTVKECEYIEAAHCIGSGNFHIVWRHILPNSVSPMVVQATIGAANAVLSASCLSFIGLGIQPPSPEWGAMLSYGRTFIRDQWYMCLIPGLALMIVVYALNTLGDGLRDAMDPHLKN